MASSWPELGEVKNKSKHKTSSSFAGALKKQSLPGTDGFTNSDNVGNLNIKKERSVAEYEEWKEKQKVKRQISKQEKKLRKEEEIRRQMVAPKGYRVQLVQNNLISTPTTSTSEPMITVPSCDLLETAFPTLGSPLLPRVKVNKVEELPKEEVLDEPTVLSKTAMKKKKLKEPITINLNQVLIQQKKRQNHLRHVKKLRKITTTKPQDILCGNPLDSSQPTRHRGKVRENPKPKKPTPLKSMILKHRQIKKLSKEQCHNYIETLCQDLDNVKLELSNICDNIESKEIDDLNKGEDNVEAVERDERMSAADVIHSTRFRNYCDHMPDPSLDDSVRKLLKLLVKLQDKAYAKDPVKAKNKKKMLTGLHEARKALIMKKVIVLILAPDLEHCPTPGGLDSKTSELISLAQNNDIPYLFALGRRKLGHILLKKVPVSCVSVINVMGAETEANEVTSRIPELRDRYNIAMGKSSPISQHITSTEVIIPEPKSSDVNKIVVSSLLSVLEESLQKPKSSAFLQAIENVEDD